MKRKLSPSFIRLFSFSRVLWFFFLLILGGFVSVSILFYRNSRAFNNTAHWVTYTHTVIDEATFVSLLSKDLQWKILNYSITGDTNLLHAYYTTRISLLSSSRRLEAIITDDSLQQKRTQRMRKRIDSLVDFADKIVDLRNDNAFSSAGFFDHIRRYEAFYDGIDKEIGTIRSEETRLLAIREAANKRIITINHIIFLTSGVLIILLLTGTFILLRHYFQKRQKAEKDLAESEKRLRVVLNSVKELAIFMIDPKGFILNWNEGASIIKGYEKEEIIGKNISIFYTEDAVTKGIPERNLQMAAQYGSYETEGWRVRKDGSFFWGDVLITAIYDEEKNVQGFIKITRDYTFHKKAKDESIRTLNKEKELNEMKSNFVSIASHEFRTPLSTILSSIGLLELYRTTETQDKRDIHIQRMRSSVNEMVSILEEFLSLEKIEEGKVVAKKELISLNEVTEHVCAKFKLILKPGQVIENWQEGTETVYFDPAFLDHILTNLISNAIKYSPENTVILLRTKVEGNSIKIIVKDQGIGISEADQQHLFERFFRASNTGKIKGTGLGLHIVKRYVDLSGGVIRLQSEPGTGSEFQVILPLTVD